MAASDVLYIARDNDRDGRRAAERLRECAVAAGVEAHVLVPEDGERFGA